MLPLLRFARNDARVCYATDVLALTELRFGTARAPTRERAAKTARTSPQRRVHRFVPLLIVFLTVLKKTHVCSGPNRRVPVVLVRISNPMHSGRTFSSNSRTIRVCRAYLVRRRKVGT